MATTYTYTLTKQERAIRDLNVAVFKAIEAAIDDGTNAKYQYIALSKDGGELKPKNLYQAGLLIGEDFSIEKTEGLVYYPGTNINYVYKSEEGEIHSFGEKYDECFVLLPGDIKIMLLDFYDHPEVEEFLVRVSKKIKGTEEEKKGPQL